MLRFTFFSARTVLLLMVGMVFAMIGYAAASANTVPQGNAGDGQGALVVYTLDTTTSPNTTSSLHVSLQTNNDPTLILKVRFTIQNAGVAPPQTVKAAFLPATGSAIIGSWYDHCALLSGSSTTWECTTSGSYAHVQTGIRLRVVAVQ